VYSRPVANCVGVLLCIVAAAAHRLGFSRVLSSWPGVQCQSCVAVLQGSRTSAGLSGEERELLCFVS